MAFPFRHQLEREREQKKINNLKKEKKPTTVTTCSAHQVTRQPRSGRSGACAPSRADKAGRCGRGPAFPPPTGRCAAVRCGRRACATTRLPVRGNTGSRVQVRRPLQSGETCVLAAFFCSSPGVLLLAWCVSKTITAEGVFWGTGERFHCCRAPGANQLFHQFNRLRLSGGNQRNLFPENVRLASGSRGELTA